MNVKIKRSARKTLVAEINKDGTILVRAPLFYPKYLIDRFLEKNEKKIVKKQKEMISRPSTPTITKEKVEEMRSFAKSYILPRVDIISKETGLAYEGVKITSARTRFGSCSGKNRICSSLFLSLADEDAIDYVILHELCHSVEHNHSKRFYNLVEKHMPDWKEREKRIKKIVIPKIEE
ncbi:MAG: M48 family metallopeptidase [Clostridia bacterium]|nr:M48 family metallopeptidase [Clostridia bacterium]